MTRRFFRIRRSVGRVRRKIRAALCRNLSALVEYRAHADWQSAIQQAASLRYDRLLRALGYNFYEAPGRLRSPDKSTVSFRLSWTFGGEILRGGRGVPGNVQV